MSSTRPTSRMAARAAKEDQAERIRGAQAFLRLESQGGFVPFIWRHAPPPRPANGLNRAPARPILRV